MTLLNIAKQDNISEAEQYRREVLSYSINSTGLLDNIKRQLGDNFVDQYWQRDQDSFKLIIVTRQEVMAQTHEYVFQEGRARGFSLPIVILPIADRSKAEMQALYRDDDVLKSIGQILAQKGAQLTTISYTPEGFKIQLTIRYSPQKLTGLDFRQLEEEIGALLGVAVAVQRSSLRVVPL